jgi:hypothetical protein
VLASAIGKPAFKRAAIISVKFQHDAPVALADADGIERLAGSPALLQAVLESASDTSPVAVTVADAIKRVHAKLKKPFKAALERRLRDHDLPAGVGWIPRKKAKALYAISRPPAEVRVATDLVLALQRAAASGEYPITIRTLATSINPIPDSKLLAVAVTLPSFCEQVLMAIPGDLDAPVARAGDGQVLGRSGALLRHLLAKARKDATHAFKANELVPKALKLHAEVRTHLVAHLAAPDAPVLLAAGVGCVRVKGAPWYFLLADAGVTSAATRNPSPRPVPELDFATRFHEAFAKLDRQRGGLNFVSLVDLRREMAEVPRDQFDAALLKLRRAREYSLTGAEGLDGLRPEERAAAIQDEGDLLLNVSRVRP